MRSRRTPRSRRRGCLRDDKWALKGLKVHIQGLGSRVWGLGFRV